MVSNGCKNRWKIVLYYVLLLKQQIVVLTIIASKIRKYSFLSEYFDYYSRKLNCKILRKKIEI